MGDIVPPEVRPAEKQPAPKQKRRRRQRPPADPSSPWITAAEAAKYCRCGPRLIYAAVGARKLRAARIGGRRELRFRRIDLDEWLEATSQPVETARGPIRGVGR